MSCDLLPGDVFCVYGNMGVVSALIRGVEKFWASDNEALYGHSGAIISSTGKTLEALWTVQEGHLDTYIGDDIIIARPTATCHGSPLTESDKLTSLAVIKQHLGRYYPVWRLPLFLFPPAAKYLGFGHWLACSELQAKYLVTLGARRLPYTGVNPDMLADEWRGFKNFDIIFEGVWGSDACLTQTWQG